LVFFRENTKIRKHEIPADEPENDACFRGFVLSIFRDDLPVMWRNVGKNARRLRPAGWKRQ